ncbi:LysR family transcriptional regulator [Mycolicibacterium sp. jd]|uniref:LysR family transcriptional regulator n=1 Tax=unclassified Mycolicibacterium TaxID=2636767 RepID=UPI00351BAFFA
MKLRQLEYFVAICESGSYTRAAAHLFVAQPSLSQQIRCLENDLGARLLDRVPQGVRPTAAGSALLPEARTILAAASRARAAVRDADDGVGRELTVMAVRSVLTHMLPPAIAAWHGRHPDSPLKQRDFHHRAALHAAMNAREGHLAIGPRPPRWQGPVYSLGFEQFVLVARTGHALPTRPADLNALSGADWVLFDEANGLTEITEAFCRAHGITARAAARCAQVESALTLALDGLGVSLLPLNAIPGSIRATHTASAGHGVFRELVVYRANTAPARASAFIDLLRELDLGLVRAVDLPARALRF